MRLSGLECRCAATDKEICSLLYFTSAAGNERRKRGVAVLLKKHEEGSGFVKEDTLILVTFGLLAFSLGLDK